MAAAANARHLASLLARHLVVLQTSSAKATNSKIGCRKAALWAAFFTYIKGET